MTENLRLSQVHFNKKGTVIIFILFVIAFASSLIITISEESVDNYEEVNKVYLMNQSYIYAKTAIKIVENLITDDDFKSDTKEDDWYNIPLYPLNNGYISIEIKPTNAKINLNNINSDERVSSAWDSLCDEYDIIDEKSPVIKDWIDNDTKISQMGLEMEEYEYFGNIYNTKNAPFDTLTELDLINSDLYNKMKNNFTVISNDNKLNVNFVDSETLEFYIPELSFYAEDIVNYREYNEYEDISEIRKAAPISNNTYMEVVDLLTVKSTTFYIKININMADVDFYYHVLLQRNQNNANVVKFFKGANKDFY